MEDGYECHFQDNNRTFIKRRTVEKGIYRILTVQMSENERLESSYMGL